MKMTVPFHVVSQLSAARIEQDAAADWLYIGCGYACPRLSVQFRTPRLPQPQSVSLFHQSADFFLALFFIGVLERWTERLHLGTLAFVATPWAVFNLTERFGD